MPYNERELIHFYTYDDEYCSIELLCINRKRKLYSYYEDISDLAVDDCTHVCEVSKATLHALLKFAENNYQIDENEYEWSNDLGDEKLGEKIFEFDGEKGYEVATELYFSYFTQGVESPSNNGVLPTDDKCRLLNFNYFYLNGFYYAEMLTIGGGNICCEGICLKNLRDKNYSVVSEEAFNYVKALENTK